MSNDYKILCEYVVNKEIELINQIRISTLEQLYQQQFTVNSNIASLKDFDQLDDNEKSLLRNDFIEMNNRVAIILAERIEFFKNNNINNLNDIKEMNEIDILKTVILQLKEIKKTIGMYDGKIKHRFLIQVFAGIVTMIDKITNWADIQYEKFVNKK